MMDAVTLAVLNGRLEQIADEMDATLYRSAFNPIIAEAHDASHGLYDALSGETLVQGKSGLPIFVGAMSFAVKAVIDRNPGGFRDGDMFIFNDPYEGGTHLNDFKLVRPFFRKGKLFCHLASVGHWHDVGGNVPGNYNPVATECWQESMLIPPVKLYDGGEYRPDILAILQANSRLPNSVLGDLNGQVAALELGVRRLGELLDEYGDAVVLEALSELRRRAVKLMRANIATLPDGKYSFEDYLDNDGIDDVPLTIAVDIDNRGEEMTLDFSRSSPGLPGAGEHRALHCGRFDLRGAQAHLPGGAGEFRRAGADSHHHPGRFADQRLQAQAGRRLYRDHPAHHRRAVRRAGRRRAGAGQRHGLRHHQCAVPRRLPHR